LDCISVGKDDKATRLTGLRMFRFRCLGLRRNISCMQEHRFKGVKTRMERFESHVVALSEMNGLQWLRVGVVGAWVQYLATRISPPCFLGVEILYLRVWALELDGWFDDVGGFEDTFPAGSTLAMKVDEEPQ
jgi:hypothetical protein